MQFSAFPLPLYWAVDVHILQKQTDQLRRTDESFDQLCALSASYFVTCGSFTMVILIFTPRTKKPPEGGFVHLLPFVSFDYGRTRVLFRIIEWNKLPGFCAAPLWRRWRRFARLACCHCGLSISAPSKPAQRNCNCSCEQHRRCYNYVSLLSTAS